MTHFWWDFTYDPVERSVAVRRWRKDSNCWARVDAQYDGLTWSEALDVFDADSTAVLVGRLAGDDA